MKKRIFSRVLALFMALSMLTTTVFAASFDDLQNAINGENGTKIENSDLTDHFGYGSQDETTGNWGVESWKEGDTNNVKLNEDVVASETTPTITVDEDQKVNLDLNNNNITGTAGKDVIDVKGDLTITGGDEEGKNVISGGATGIDVEKGGTLALNSVTVTGNEIGVAFFDPLSVTFIGDQNVVSNNTTKNIEGRGKVNFKLTDKDGKEVTYKVDASTAETLLADKGKVAAHGHNSVYPSSTWILVKNDDGATYTIVCAGTKDQGIMSWIDVNNSLSDATKAAGCEVSAITKFVIPNEVTKITDSAFKNKAYLEEINLPENLTTIEINAFTDCTNLRGDIVFPKTLKSMALGAFYGCASLTGISFDEDCELKTIPGNAFRGCTGLKGTVNVPKNVTSVEAGAFEDCSGLEEITLPEGLERIGRTAFIRAKNLKEINIPSTVTSIGDRAFAHCTELETIEIPKGVQTIEEYTFYNCSGLTGTLTLPEGLTSLGTNAFGKTSGLASIEFPSTLAWVDAGAFSESGIKSAVHYLAEDQTASDVSAAIEAMKKTLDSCNLFVMDGEGNLSFYRGEVTVNFGHNADNSVNLDDGSVVLTNVSGTITGEREVTLPNVAGITASIDTDGKITVNIPAGGEEYPYGATVTTDPEGKIVVTEGEPDLPVISFDFDATTADTDTTIDDQAVPLAGLVSRAQLVSYLYAREGSPDGEDAEDEYTLAWAWGVENEIVDEEDDPEEIVTVAIFREIMTSYAKLLNTTFDVVIEDEDDMPLMNCDEILTEFYASLKSKAA